MKHHQGYSLIELVIVIVILTIAATSLFMGFDTAMTYSGDVSDNARAMYLAQQRMELIIGQKIKNGFSTFVDPCVSLFASPATDNICSKNAFAGGYTVSSVITSNWNGNAFLKSIVVTVSGSGSASLTTVVGDT